MKSTNIIYIEKYESNRLVILLLRTHLKNQHCFQIAAIPYLKKYIFKLNEILSKLYIFLVLCPM